MDYWDSEYPTHIEVPNGYWIISNFFDFDIEYLQKEDEN